MPGSSTSILSGAGSRFWLKEADGDSSRSLPAVVLFSAESRTWLPTRKAGSFRANGPSGHIEQLSTAFARCVRHAGLRPEVVTPHVMRHTAITRLASSGADIKTIQEFSGHESLQMVMRYAHAQDRAVDLALDRLEREHPVNKSSGQS